MEGLGCIKEEGGTSFVSNYSIRPPIRFEIPQSWTNLLLFYFYKWPCAGGRRLSSNKVDGCWLDDDPRIFVSAIICQVLSTITSGSDIGDCTLRWYYALPGLVINYKSDPQIIMILKLLHSVSISVICDSFFAILTHFIGAFPQQFKRVASYLSSSCIIMSCLLTDHHLIGQMSQTEASDWLMLVTWVWCQPTWSVSACWTLFISHKHLFSSHPDTQGDIKIPGI